MVNMEPQHKISSTSDILTVPPSFTHQQQSDPSTMICFLAAAVPVSVNARSKSKYKQALVTALTRTHPTPPTLTGRLYGFAYYFHKQKTQLDADNLSKPIWDALNGHLYSDDKQIGIRYSGIFNLGGDISVLELTNMRADVLRTFLSMIQKEDHVLYIEVGKHNNKLFVFNGERL